FTLRSLGPGLRQDRAATVCGQIVVGARNSAIALGWVALEHFLDSLFKRVGDRERQRQRRIEMPVLNRDDGVAGHAYAGGQLGLGPSALRAQHPYSVFHEGSRAPRDFQSAQPTPSSAVQTPWAKTVVMKPIVKVTSTSL